jgi:hypothetical protein
MKKGVMGISPINYQNVMHNMYRFTLARPAPGFGPLGAIETERIRINNPPLLVRDSNGTVVREWTGSDGEKKTATFREDPAAATREVVAHTVSLIGKDWGTIEPGSVGNTTSVFYPDANPESTSVDGTVEYQAAVSWDTAHDATAGTAADDTGGTGVGLMVRTRWTGTDWNFGRPPDQARIPRRQDHLGRRLARLP